MNRLLVKETVHQVGKKVKLAGRVATVRDHGKLTFVDLADVTGVVQAVSRKPLKVSPFDVVSIEGTVKKRPENLINHDLETGTVEIEVENLVIISKSQTPPIPSEGDGYDIDENLRLKYRYLDLARPRLQKNLKLRHKIATHIRNFLNSEDFVEIETPYLSKTTPEGARDFITPSRLHPGKFYALAQAPQQYKQLLMIAGFEKYFQFARAFRDEDMRADRQFEHTQIDIEMAHVTREDVLALVENMIVDLTHNLKREIFKKPFPIFTYKEAIEKFKADKFDLRKRKDDKTLAFAWVIDFPLLEYDGKNKRYTFSHNPFTSPKEEDLEKLKAEKDLDNILSYQYDLVLNGEELGSGSIRITDPKIQKQAFKVMSYSEKKVEEDFGHLLAAYEYGAPKHGGIAIGLDRLTAVLAGEQSIREVIAFPISGGGTTSVMDAPSPVDDDILKELNIKVSSKEK